MKKEFQPRYKWAFKVTTQEEADLLKNTALELGYKWSAFEKNDWDRWPYLFNNYNTVIDIGFGGTNHIEPESLIVDWSLDLFKAVILASEGEDFIPGEWAKCIKQHNPIPGKEVEFTENRLYEVSRDSKGSNSISVKICDNGRPNGWGKDYFTKPSILDIQNHFKPKEKLNTTNKQTKINVKGSKNLIAAFIEEISTIGWEPTNPTAKTDCIRLEHLSTSMSVSKPKAYSQALWPGNIDSEFNLPQNWDSALKAFKNYDKVEYKVEDWVKIIRNQGGHPVGSIGQIIDTSSHDFTIRVNEVTYYNSYDAIIPATPEEIEKATKPQKIIVKCKYQDGEFDVKVKAGTTQMESADGIFTIGAIQDIYTLMINPASCTENEVHTGNTWEIEFPYVNVGCKKMVPLSSINDIIVAWGKLNNKR